MTTFDATRRVHCLPRTGEDDLAVTGEVVADYDGKPGTGAARRDKWFRWFCVRVIVTDGELPWVVAVEFHSNCGEERTREDVWGFESLVEMAAWLDVAYSPLAGLTPVAFEVGDPRMDRVRAERERLVDKWRSAVDLVVGE